MIRAVARMTLLRGLVAALLLLVPLLLIATPASARGEAGWEAADTVQKTISGAQLSLFSGDSAAAAAEIAAATETYNSVFSPLTGPQSADYLAAGKRALEAAADAAAKGDETRFVAAGASLQTALYGVGYQEALAALQRGDTATAGDWLLLREFREVSRFERLKSDSTLALADLGAGKIDAATARATVQVDLLDTYQARMDVALHDLRLSDTRTLASSRAQYAALAEGYFAILAPLYREQRGDAALLSAQTAFVTMLEEAQAGRTVKDQLAVVDEALRGFRAAPLSPAEQTRRANQLLRFIALVPVEYGRGVKDGRVTIALEIQEASTFRDGAAAAFNDLRSILDTRDAAKTERIAVAFADLETQLLGAKDGSNVADLGQIEVNANIVTTLFTEITPAEWQQRDSGADFDIISTTLDNMENMVKAGDYAGAELVRLEAYAFLEIGPEAKLVVFAPQLKAPIEDMFWYGQGEHIGLAALIANKAPAAEIAATRAALDVQLQQAEIALEGNNAPAAVAGNAALIVFREGLEAVLILASLMGSLKIGTQRALRKPIWGGVVVALLATVLTYLLAQGLLTTLASYGERLEAVVSLVAVAVLLLITNWFFHDVYWTGWMAKFHKQKKRIMIGGAASQFIGLVVLGFTSIYREGFETVLFLQALVLEAGTATVMAGVAVGFAATVLIGLLVFVVQAKLPHKKMLVFTGILIGVVLVQMVGNTAHVLQVVGWLPIHPIAPLASILPYWTGMWFGVYGTWETLLLQAAAAAFTIGSYFLAERGHKRPESASREPHTARVRSSHGS